MKRIKHLGIILTTIGCMLLFASAHSPRKDHSFETPIQVEQWMTKPFSDFVEEPIMLEDWMTKPFTIIKK